MTNLEAYDKILEQMERLIAVMRDAAELANDGDAWANAELPKMRATFKRLEALAEQIIRGVVV